MTPERLREIGEARYGRTRWKAPLARELGVSTSMIYRWLKGEWPIPKMAELALKELARDAKPQS